MSASMQPEIVFDGHAAIEGGAVWATGSDDVFGVGKLVGAVGLHTGKIKVSGRLSGKRSSPGLVRCLRTLVVLVSPQLRPSARDRRAAQ